MIDVEYPNFRVTGVVTDSADIETMMREQREIAQTKLEMCFPVKTGVDHIVYAAKFFTDASYSEVERVNFYMAPMRTEEYMHITEKLSKLYRAPCVVYAVHRYRQ